MSRTTHMGWRDNVGSQWFAWPARQQCRRRQIHYCYDLLVVECRDRNLDTGRFQMHAQPRAHVAYGVRQAFGSERRLVHMYCQFTLGQDTL